METSLPTPMTARVYVNLPDSNVGRKLVFPAMGILFRESMEEGDDLHFEVVDYDRGALQGDLMCSCIVPNKEREGKLKEERDDINDDSNLRTGARDFGWWIGRTSRFCSSMFHPFFIHFSSKTHGKITWIEKKLNSASVVADRWVGRHICRCRRSRDPRSSIGSEASMVPGRWPWPPSWPSWRAAGLKMWRKNGSKHGKTRVKPWVKPW